MALPETIKIILFMIAVFISNIVQALTGFAGVMLSIPPTILLYGPDMAKALINFICWLVGVVLMWQNRKYIVPREWLKIIVFMLVGMGLGIHLYTVINTGILVPFYGAVIIAAALKNLFFKPPDHLSAWIAIPVLLGAGIIHGMFASGGALLVIYLAATFKDKKYFRANVAAVWTVLNLVLMGSDYEKGLFNQEFFELLGYSLIPLIAAVYLGNKAHDKINQKTFNYITYGLLLLSGSMIII
ncbi:MAG: sulfite exporter TauE/SafE family protein [Dialister sp.]|nr:sulfite exporter TauE/SafE family protein [Dialister sp.]